MKDFSSIKLKSEGITDERILNTLLKYEKKDFFPNEKNSLINSDIDFIDEKSFMVLRTVSYGKIIQFLNLNENKKVLVIGSNDFYFFSVISDLCGQLFVLTDYENDNFRKNVIFINKNGYQTTYDYSPFDNIIIIEPSKKINKTYLSQIRINGSIFFREISDNLIINSLITKKSDTFIQRISLYEEEYFR